MLNLSSEFARGEVVVLGILHGLSSLSGVATGCSFLLILDKVKEKGHS